MLRGNFGQDVLLDLSSAAKEYEHFRFPCSQILVSDEWEVGLNAARPDKFGRYMQFRTEILNAYRSYQLPVIELKKETTKEAVCLVFEKVNTGGVPLSVFELVTASYAAEGFNLRKDWYGEGAAKGRHARLAAKPLLKGTAATEFLQGISLLYTYDRQAKDLAAEKSGKEVTGVSAKREHILAMPLAAFQRWADPLTAGFLKADEFLRHFGFHHPNFLPYRAQIIPLAAVLTHIGDRWLEPQLQDKLVRWFWCGVFGELYGSASESRIALDLPQLLRWLTQDGPLPATVVAAGFQPSRLETMRSRTSAAYRGLYILLQQLGAKDFFWKAKMVDIDRNERGIDIHHTFPRKWCLASDIPPRVFDSIINKTAISYKANRKIGGNAPSKYLKALQDDKSVQLKPAAMDAILHTHAIDPALLRADDFERFYQARKAALLALIEGAMGKEAIMTSDEPMEDDLEE